jgi:hypothetical protein
LEDHILDLDKRLWAHTRYGLTIVGTWVRIDRRWRPCMAIVRASGEMRPCVIPLERAWQWSDLIGDPRGCAERILLRLGIDPLNPDNVDKLISLVNSRMGDLVTMPPRPADAEEHAAPVAELAIRNHPDHADMEVSI